MALDHPSCPTCSHSFPENVAELPVNYVLREAVVFFLEYISAIVPKEFDDVAQSYELDASSIDNVERIRELLVEPAPAEIELRAQLPVIQAAIQTNPTVYTLRTYRASLNIKLGLYSDASHDIHFCISHPQVDESTKMDAYFQAGSVYMALGHYSRAIEAYKTMMEIATTLGVSNQDFEIAKNCIKVCQAKLASQPI